MPVSDCCLIFDLDGTLVDSEGLSLGTLHALLPQLPESTDVIVRRYRGWKFAAILDDLERRYGLRTPVDFEARFRVQMKAVFTAQLQTMPHVPAMLTQLSAPFCVASNGPRAKIEHALTVTGLAAYFGDRLFSAYEIGAWKPDPRLFLHAAATMGFAPARCIVIEDSDTGIAAANAAGMTAFLYDPDGHVSGNAAHTVFSDMRELPRLLANFSD